MRVARWLIGALTGVSALAHGAGAMEPEGGTRWRCWYVPAVESPVIACRLLEAGVPGEVAPTAASKPLPSMVQQIRNDPQSLVDNVVVIPLHAPPIDMRLAARLAKSVMCGARASCSVDFANEPGG
jgi:hypothetical protein